MLNSFKDPPPEHRIHALWLWNSTLDPDEVERQARELHRQGFGGFVIEHDPDILERNSEPEVMRALDRAARTAFDSSLRAYLHDPRKEFVTPQNNVWSKFMYFLGHKDRADSRNPAALKNLMRLGEFAECFWSVPMEEVKGAVDWQMSLGGTTMLAPRMPFAIEGCDGGAVERFYDAPSWPYQKLLADYAARLSYALSQGREHAQVALLAANTDQGQVTPEVAAICTDLYCRTMLREHIGFDIITEDALANASCTDQLIRANGAEYEALIMPPITQIRPRTARKIADFADDGGILVGTGLLPYAGSQGSVQPWIRNTFKRIFGMDPVELEHNAVFGRAADVAPLRSEENPVMFFALGWEADIGLHLREALEKVMRLEVSARWRSVECPDITFAHYVLENGDLFFFANSAASPREVQLAIRCEGAPHFLDPETGEYAALANCTQHAGRTLLLHRFERYGSLLVYFGSEPAFRVRKLTSGLEGREVAVLERWEHFSNNGDTCALCRADVEIPVVGRGESVVLRADGPAGVVEFVVNNVQAGVRAWAPFEIDVTHLVRPNSTNLIEIRDVDVSHGMSGRSVSTARVAIC